MGDGQEHYSCSTTRLRELYERLRAYALTTLEPPVQVYGLGVIMFRGMAAWINTAKSYAEVQHIAGNNGLKPVGMPEDERTQLQEILAEVLMQHCHREISW